MSVKNLCWSTVCDDGPTLTQHWVDSLCLSSSFNMPRSLRSLLNELMVTMFIVFSIVWLCLIK